MVELKLIEKYARQIGSFPQVGDDDDDDDDVDEEEEEEEEEEDTARKRWFFMFIAITLLVCISYSSGAIDQGTFHRCCYSSQSSKEVHQCQHLKTLHHAVSYSAKGDPSKKNTPHL